MDEPVLVEVRERVALVTLNRPEARNALSGALMRSLASTMADLDERDDVDAIVLTGADPAFSAGLDLKEPFAVKLAADVAGNDQAGVRRMRRTYADIHTDVAGLQLEAEVSTMWRKAAFDPALVAERRESISARGRAQ